MGTNVNANGRSILHKGHGQTHTCAPPDVCKTPSPGGPVPIPYVNIAMDSDIADGADTVKIEGNPASNVGAKVATSTGDEPGSAGGGIVSSKIKGTVTWKMGSLDVKAEGKMLVRFLEQGLHNGNSGNTTFIAPGATGLKYADDFEEDLCPVCEETREKHEILETKSSAELCAKIIECLQQQWDGLLYGDDVTAKKRVAKVESYNQDTNVWTWRGYMVGVMICACKPPKSFAAMSGGKSSSWLPGFQEACDSAGIDVVVNSGRNGACQKSSVKWQDLANANTSKSPLVAARLRDFVEKRWKRRRGPGYTEVGKCAGQHLLAKSGHAPTAMTEMFFAPANWNGQALTPGWFGQTYDFLVDGARGDRRFGTDQPTTEENPWGTSVGSCKTCQELLFLSMCPERVCK